MEENKFFKLVWRFNGLIISLAGILAIAVLLFISYKLIKDVTRNRTTHNIVNVDEKSEIKEKWNFGQLSEITNKEIMMIPLQSDQTFNRTYFSKSSNSTRNYLFINTKTSQKWWLFDHTNYLIEHTKKLRLGDYSSKEPVLAIFYQLVKLDSNHDNRLSEKDLTTIALTKPDGSNYKEIITNIELIIDSKLLNKDELFLIYQKDGVTYSAILNLKSQELIKNNKIPKIGENKGS